MRIDPQRIRDAQSLLARHFGPTRIARAASLSSPGHDVFLKIETDLPTGSFKVRGAIYALSMKIERDRLRTAAGSLGGRLRQHRQPRRGGGLRRAAARASRATIFLPVNPNPVKAARIRDLGARLVEVGRRSQRRDRRRAGLRDAHAGFLPPRRERSRRPGGHGDHRRGNRRSAAGRRRHLRADGRHRADPRRRVGREAAAPRRSGSSASSPNRRRRICCRGEGEPRRPADNEMSSKRRRATPSPTASRSGGRWRRTSPRFASWSTTSWRSARRR